MYLDSDWCLSELCRTYNDIEHAGWEPLWHPNSVDQGTTEVEHRSDEQPETKAQHLVGLTGPQDKQAVVDHWYHSAQAQRHKHN